MNESNAGPSKATETVTLKRAHVHQRTLYQPGDKITLRPDQAKRLKARKIAE